MAADSNPANWDPAELLLYADEYLGLYIDFRFRFRGEYWDESYPRIAVSYLDSALDCVQDAHAALTTRWSV